MTSSTMTLKAMGLLALTGSLLLSANTMAQRYPEPGNFAQGAKSWSDNCARCHNMRDPQDLRDDQWITTVYHMRTRAGLTGQQTRDILTFLQESNNRVAASAVDKVDSETSDAVSLSGDAVYAKTCVACHGVDGKGTVPGAPDFTNPSGPLSQSDDVLIQHITAGFKRPDSPMAMPPMGGNPDLTAADIRAVLGYLREKFGGN